MSNLITLQNTQTMSSREIAELTGKELRAVHRDIKKMISELYGLDDPNLDHKQIQGVIVEKDERNYISLIHLDREHSLTLVTGYDVKRRHAVNKRWLELEAKQPSLPQPTAMDVADWVFARLPNLCERSRQEIVSRTANKIAGFEMIPLPKITEQFWTAGELAKEFGCTANRIGRIANAHGLKTGEYGEHRLSKSKHSTRQVEMFFYNEKGRAALARLVLEIATH